MVKDFGAAIPAEHWSFKYTIGQFAKYPEMLKEFQDKTAAYARTNFTAKNAEVFLKEYAA
jgi:hypothetical protein